SIHEALHPARPTKPNAKRAIAAAMMIAMYAQNRMQDPAANVRVMATLRDQAMTVAEAIANGKYAEARKAAGGLSPNPPQNPKAIAKAISLKVDWFELDDLMNQMASTRSGGLQIEAKIAGWLGKGKLNDQDLQNIAPVASRISQIADYAELHVPEKERPGRTKKQWMDRAGKMKELAVDLREAARKGDHAGTIRILAALDRNCRACH